MEITEVKVFPVSEEKLKAFVSIVFDRCFMVNDIKIIQGRDGLFISMPSRKKKNGEFKDVAHPLNNETRQTIEIEVVREYERVLAERGESLPAPARAFADSDDSAAEETAQPRAAQVENAPGRDGAEGGGGQRRQREPGWGQERRAQRRRRRQAGRGTAAARSAGSGSRAAGDGGERRRRRHQQGQHRQGGRGEESGGGPGAAPARLVLECFLNRRNGAPRGR